jgi:hypothetical protein
MNWNVAVIGIAAGLTMIIVNLELLRRRALKERYALLWLVLAVFLIVLSVWSDLLQKIADLLNVYYAPSIIFGLSFLFVFAIMIHFSVVLSRQSKGYNKMIQQLSILEEKIEELNENRVSEDDLRKDAHIDVGVGQEKESGGD